MRQMQQQLSGQIGQMQHLCAGLCVEMVQLNGQMDQLNGRMDQLQAQGAQAVTGIQLQFSQMNDDLRQVTELWNEKFDQVLGQLGTMDNRFATMDNRFATMDNRFANFATELTGIHSKLDKVLDQIRKGHVVDNKILARLTALENMEDETTALLAALEKKGRAPLAPFN